MIKQPPGAANMKSGGTDESAGTHGNHPQRAGWEDGHQLNESYKVPGAHQAGRTMNHSYMHPQTNPGSEWAPKMKGKDDVEGEQELKTKAPSGMSGKVVFASKTGKNKV